jgi:ABC-2 type transport system permease protein
VLKFIIRISAFIRKEIFTILRQPRLVFSLILGPFFILLIFGLGYRNVNRTFETLFVVPEDSQIGELVEQYAESMGTNIQFAGVTSNADEADRRLRAQEVDLVVVTPADPYNDVQNNNQAVFSLYHYEIDPFEQIFVDVLGRRYTEAINQQILLTAAEQGKIEAETMQEHIGAVAATAGSVRTALEAGDGLAASTATEQLNEDINLMMAGLGTGMAIFDSVQETTEAVDEEAATVLESRLAQMQDSLAVLQQIDTGQTDFDEEIEAVATIEGALEEIDTVMSEFRRIDAGVLVSPFRSEVLSITNTALEPTHFYVPAVIALLFQHLAVALAGLSIVREEREGTMELFRASPVSALETLVGKYVSYLLLTAVLALILTTLVIFLLQVPMFGNWVNYALVLCTLIFTSLGIGFLISINAQSDSQAIQWAMIMLLASIFFSGLFLPLYRLSIFVHILSWSLPATYGTSLLQSVMLRGQNPNILLVFVLLSIGLVLFLISWWRLRRKMAHE